MCNADEIVRLIDELRQDAYDYDQGHTQNFFAVTRRSRESADLIESLQAQLGEYEACAARYGIDARTMLTLAKSQIETAKDNVLLVEMLAASQRREKAAVEQIPRYCNTCKKTCSPSDETRQFKLCPDWEWRGPQEARKGGAEREE